MSFPALGWRVGRLAVEQQFRRRRQPQRRLALALFPDGAATGHVELRQRMGEDLLRILAGFMDPRHFQPGDRFHVRERDGAGMRSDHHPQTSACLGHRLDDHAAEIDINARLALGVVGQEFDARAVDQFQRCADVQDHHPRTDRKAAPRAVGDRRRNSSGNTRRQPALLASSFSSTSCPSDMKRPIFVLSSIAGGRLPRPAMGGAARARREG